MKIRCILGICLVLTAAGRAQTASDQTQYFALFMEGKKVGYAIQNRVVAEGKVTTTEQVSLTISRLNMPVTMNTTETSIETIDGKPLAFEALQDFSMMMIKINGKVNKNGKVITVDIEPRIEKASKFDIFKERVEVIVGAHGRSKLG